MLPMVCWGGASCAPPTVCSSYAPTVLLLGLVNIPLDARQSLDQPVVTAQVVAQFPSPRSSDLKPQPHTHICLWRISSPASA